MYRATSYNLKCDENFRDLDVVWSRCRLISMYYLKMIESSKDPIVISSTDEKSTEHCLWR